VAVIGCSQEPPPPQAPTPPPREAFHAAKPLKAVVASAVPDAKPEETDWLQSEVSYLLRRGQMRIVDESQASAPVFVLAIHVDLPNKQAVLKLIAPDQFIERERKLELSTSTRLEIVTTLARTLPAFLDASHASEDWSTFIGTQDARVYENYLRNANELLGPSAQGITRAPASRPQARTVERLEALAKQEQTFARAWAALAIGYLSLGGDDLSSLTDLAQSSAQRALVMDDDLAAAHAALGMVDLRRNDWIAAHEKFEWALALDPNHPVALEGLTCLNADAGHYREALMQGIRAIAQQPRNAGALECLTFARLGSQSARRPSEEETLPASAARVRALAAFLKGDRQAAERSLRSAMSAREFEIWGAPLARAAGKRALVPDALKAITRAANDGYIDSATEILCGAALRQPEFVFNRISRLQREDMHAPLRVLWLPDAGFLRSHPRFEETIGAAGLAGFWHGSGPPDICEGEPNVYGCNLSGSDGKKSALVSVP
jgi:tetratricopeptide (TPR) repeat protein